MKFKYLVVVLSLISLVALYLISSLSQPAIVPFSKIPANEGKQVTIQGIVAGYQTTTTGSTLVTLRNNDTANTTTITLFVEGQLAFEYGDLVQATGTVQQYKNQWELSVTNPQSVTVLMQWGNRSFPLWQLAKNPTRYVDTNVNVTGVVGTVFSSGFTLLDPTGVSSVSVSFTHASTVSISKGNQVAVKAQFLYDEATLSYRLKATDSADAIIVLE
jgi:DNA/RNA endonuclease YhcR with UshA esterase domain